MLLSQATKAVQAVFFLLDLYNTQQVNYPG